MVGLCNIEWYNVSRPRAPPQAIMIMTRHEVRREGGLMSRLQGLTSTSLRLDHNLHHDCGLVYGLWEVLWSCIGLMKVRKVKRSYCLENHRLHHGFWSPLFTYCPSGRSVWTRLWSWGFLSNFVFHLIICGVILNSYISYISLLTPILLLC